MSLHSIPLFDGTTHTHTHTHSHAHLHSPHRPPARCCPQDQCVLAIESNPSLLSTPPHHNGRPPSSLPNHPLQSTHTHIYTQTSPHTMNIRHRRSSSLSTSSDRGSNSDDYLKSDEQEDQEQCRDLDLIFSSHAPFACGTFNLPPRRYQLAIESAAGYPAPLASL